MAEKFSYSTSLPAVPTVAITNDRSLNMFIVCFLFNSPTQKSELLRYSSEESSESEAEPSTSLEKDDKYTASRDSEEEEELRPEDAKEDSVEGLREKNEEDDDDEKSQVMTDSRGVKQPQPGQSVYNEEDLIEEGTLYNIMRCDTCTCTFLKQILGFFCGFPTCPHQPL